MVQGSFTPPCFLPPRLPLLVLRILCDPQFTSSFFLHVLLSSFLSLSRLLVSPFLLFSSSSPTLLLTFLRFPPSPCPFNTFHPPLCFSTFPLSCSPFSLDPHLLFFSLSLPSFFPFSSFLYFLPLLPPPICFSPISLLLPLSFLSHLAAGQQQDPR